jgi:hypothetical protein
MNEYLVSCSLRLLPLVLVVLGNHFVFDNSLSRSQVFEEEMFIKIFLS